MTPGPAPPLRAGALLLGLLLLAAYAEGVVSPDTWWGTHFLAFLPAGARAGALGAAALLMLGGVVPGPWRPWLAGLDLPAPARVVWPVVVAVHFGALLFQLPIAADHYGDADRFRAAWEQADPALQAGRWDQILSLDVHSAKIGERTVLNAVQRLAGASDWAGVHAAFRVVGAVAGGLWALVWLLFVGAVVESPVLRWVLAAAGLLAPFVQVFAGHDEIYAPSMPVVLAFLAAAVLHLRTGRDRWLAAMPPLLLLAMKLHASAVMLAPALLLVAARRASPWLRARFGWRAGWAALLALWTAGGVVYVAVLGDHRDPRWLSPGLAPTERLFLPLFAPPAPLDRYTLLSGAHLFDLLQVALLWSAPALLVLLVAALVSRRVDWSAPEVVVSGVTLLLYGSLFFMINPLLGMQLDWDLFCLPAPALLVFVATVAINTRAQGLGAAVAGPALALCLVGWPAASAVDHDREALSQRLEALGTSAFRGVWNRASGTIDRGIALSEAGPDEALRRRVAVAERLRPWAVPGHDVEYADLLWRVGRHHRDERHDHAAALPWHEEAARYAPHYGPNQVGLMEANFMLGRYAEAHEAALGLVAEGYPDPRKALRIALHCALEAGLVDAAIEHGEAYLRLAPGDRSIFRVVVLLRAGDGPERALSEFALRP